MSTVKKKNENNWLHKIMIKIIIKPMIKTMETMKTTDDSENKEK